MSKSFAERMRLLRGKTSRELFSNKIGISERSLVNYEQGIRNPKGNIVAQISARLGVSPTWLLTGEGAMYPEENTQKEAVVKNGDVSQVKKNNNLELLTENANICDLSQVLALQQELIHVSRDNVYLLRQNGDLRVEIERQKARIAELERQLAEALKPQERPPVLDERSAAAG